MGLPRKKDGGDITLLLRDYQHGNAQALEALMPLVYDQLKRIAINQMRVGQGGHTLSPTGLVHEAFLKLSEASTLTAKDRSHFFAIAAQTMRWLLTDYARARQRDKRGGKSAGRIVFDESHHSPRAELDASDLVDALDRLEKQDPRLCRVVELRQLVGLSVEETAAALGVAPRTVKRDWVAAKAWLARELKQK